jgi:hypothetical protein
MHPAQHSHQHSHLLRRDFFRTVMGAPRWGVRPRLAQYRAAWAQAIAPSASLDLFEIEKSLEIEKVADDVYFAHAKPTAISNCNA